MSELETDRYHILKPIPIFQNLLTDIFADILTKYFG